MDKDKVIEALKATIASHETKIGDLKNKLLEHGFAGEITGSFLHETVSSTGTKSKTWIHLQAEQKKLIAFIGATCLGAGAGIWHVVLKLFH